MSESLFAAGRRDRPPVHRLWIEAMSAVTPMPRHAVLAARRSAPQGDGHPVMLNPAFLRGDRYMPPLRRFLSDSGYAVYGWRLGVNVGPTDRILSVSLIGHSLGGAVARELAKKRPEDVRLLIVLSSPIRIPTASPLEPIYRMLSRWHSPSSSTLYASFNEPPRVPVTAIHTRSDGIVAWQSCFEVEGECRENIEVAGPHSTMARNPAAWRIIADRLAQGEGKWQPYMSARSTQTS